MFAFVSGLLTSLSLIIAIGAQNAFILRQALARNHVFMMAIIAALADALLILVGVLGLSVFIEGNRWLLEVIRWLGAGYLVWFAIKSFRASMKSETMDAGAGQNLSRKNILVSLLGFTFLNPHVYLDTVIFVGSLAQPWGDLRMNFAVGAMTASFIWFFSLAYGAKALSKFVTKPSFWKVLDRAIGALMLFLAGSLLFAQL